MDRGKGEPLKLLHSTRSLFLKHDGDSPTAGAARAAGLLSFVTSTTPVAISLNQGLNRHQSFAWQQQPQSSDSRSSSSSGACTFASNTFIVSVLFLVPVTILTVNTLLDLEILPASSERSYTFLDFTPFSNSSGSSSCGKVGVGGPAPADGEPRTREQAEACSRGVLKVFVYDIPQAFSAGLMTRDFKKLEADWEAALSNHEAVPMLSEMRDGIPEWQDGGVFWDGHLTKLEDAIPSWNEHSVEHYLTADILAAPQERERRSHAVRVMDPEEADIFFLPLYSSCIDNRLFGKTEILAEIEFWVLSFLFNSPWWQRSGGSDHVIPFTYPLALSPIRKHLSNAMFIVVDFWTYKYPSFVSNLTKDVVAPYHHFQPYFSEEDELRRLWNITGFSGRAESPGSHSEQQQQQQKREQKGEEAAASAEAASLWSLRDILVYFRGRVNRHFHGGIRRTLQEVLRDEPGVVYVDSKTTAHEIEDSTAEFRRSKFCLVLVGDSPSSGRLFDAIASGCVPIVISDSLDLPFESTIDYSDRALFVSEKDAVQKGYLMKLVRSISEQEWTNLQQKMREVWHHMEFHQPSKSEDAVDIIWRDVKHRRCKWYGNLFENKNKRMKQAKLL